MKKTKTNQNRSVSALRLISLLCSFVILLCSVPFGAGAVNYKKATYDDIKNETTESLKDQITELETLIEEQKAALEEAEALQKDAAEKREIYLTIEALYTDTLSMLESEKVILEAEVAETGRKIAENRAEYEETYRNFLEVMRMTYEQGNANYIEIILGASSLSDLLSRLDRVGSIMNYSDRLIQKLEERKAVLDSEYAELAAQNAEKEQAIEQFEAKEAEVQQWIEENKAELDRIEGKIDELIAQSDEYGDRVDVLDKEFQDMVTELEAEENAKRKAAAEKAYQEALAAAERKRLAEEAAKKAAIEAAARAQSFIWPLPDAYNHVTSAFGMRYHPVYKKYLMHYGIDIGAVAGTNIYACKEGYVSIAKYHVTYGYYVLINHQDGTSTVYAHCSKLLTSAGKTVKQGDVIAKVGMTGTATGNHLHFEVRVNGTCVDPLSAVKLIKPAGLKVE